MTARAAAIPPSTCKAPKGVFTTTDPVIGFCGVLAGKRPDGRFDVMLANAHLVIAHAGGTLMGTRPATGSRVRVEWPHDAPGGWRLAGAN